MTAMPTWLNKARARLASRRGGPFVALDIDRCWLRVVYAGPGPTGRSGGPEAALPRFRKLAAIEVPEGLDAADPEAVGRFIGESLRGLGLHGTRVAMDVPRSKAVLKTVTLPAVDDERELPGMVRYQVEKELPFSIDEAVIDFTVESHLDAGKPTIPATEVAEAAEPRQCRTVLVAAVRRSVVDYYRAVAEAAGIDLQQLGLRPYADVHCLRACLTGRESELAHAVLVHLTADEAEINVLVDSSLAFSRSASTAIPHDEQGNPLADSPVDAMAMEVVRTVQSVRAAQPGVKIEQVWVAGETSHEWDLAAALSKRLKAPCEKLRPAEALRIKPAPAGADGYITAIGLAIGHTGRGMPLDFLHPKRPPVERNMVKVRATYGAVTAAAVVSIGLCAGLVNLWASSHKLETLRRHEAELEEERRPIDKLRARTQAIEEWASKDQRWLDHWANITAAFPPAEQVYVTSLKTNPKGSLTLTVQTRGSAVITDLAKRLRTAGYDVELGSETVGTDEFGYPHTTTIDLAILKEIKLDIAGLKAPPRPADDGSADALRRKEGGRGG